MTKTRGGSPARTAPGGPGRPLGEAIRAEAMAIAIGGLNLDTVETAIGDMAEAVKLQAQVLRDPEQYGDVKLRCAKCHGQGAGCQPCEGRGYVVVKPDLGVIAKALKATTDSTDTLLRLTQFAQGLPDSHQHISGKDWLALLTDDEIRMLMERAKAREGAR